VLGLSTVRALPDALDSAPFTPSGGPPLGEDVHSEDQLLTEDLINGTAGAWERFIERFSGFVHAVARRLLLSRGAGATNADVEDVAENVFIALMEKDYHLLRRYNPSHKLSTYLGVICRTQAHRWLRRKRHMLSLTTESGSELIEGNEPAVQEALVRREAIGAVRRSLQSLGERDQRVLRLFYFDGASYQAIARELGVKVNSVGALLTRARAKLQDLLKKDNDMSESDYRDL